MNPTSLSAIISALQGTQPSSYTSPLAGTPSMYLSQYAQSPNNTYAASNPAIAQQNQASYLNSSWM